MMTEAGSREAELEREIMRLKEVVAAKPPEDGKTVRVEMNTTADGRPCLIVTAPVYFEEERLGSIIASVMNLWCGVAGELAKKKRLDKIRQKMKTCRLKS